MVPGGFPPQDLLEVYIYWGDFFLPPSTMERPIKSPKRMG